MHESGSWVNYLLIKEKEDSKGGRDAVSADPVAEVGWQPADDDLIRVLVPEEVNPHTVAVLAGVPPDDVELQEHALRGADGILDVVGFALLTGAAFVDGTGEIHAILGEHIPKSLVRADAIRESRYSLARISKAR